MVTVLSNPELSVVQTLTVIEGMFTELVDVQLLVIQVYFAHTESSRAGHYLQFMAEDSFLSLYFSTQVS